MKVKLGGNFNEKRLTGDAKKSDSKNGKIDHKFGVGAFYLKSLVLHQNNTTWRLKSSIWKSIRNVF